MAKDSTTAKTSSTGVVMPDVAEWDNHRPRTEEGPVSSTIIGIDQEQWAVAVVDLASRADRVEAERHRLAQRGYRQIQGDVTVVGYRKPEIWVKPRHIYEQDRKAKRQRLRNAVLAGYRPDTALLRPIVKGSDKRGNEITLSDD